MKTPHFLNILLAVALVILSVKIAFFETKTVSSVEPSAHAESIIMENLLTRTSIRAYQPKPVEEEKIEQLLRAAMAAPTAGNKQPWRFVVIKEQATLQNITDNFGSMKMVASAPLAIVVCGDTNSTFPGHGVGYWVQDASAATQNLLLAAHGLGLGAVWCGVTPLPERVAHFKELLNLPEHIEPLNVIAIGYPAEDPAPKNKWKPAYIHYESWKN
ncbi:MAG: nitroreductase family protein [Phocaeicola sp.]